MPPRDDEDLAPETRNNEQEDEESQAQTLADEVLAGRTERFSESDKVTGGIDIGNSTPDLVDHMNQMATSGRIDMSAYRGERNDDDESGLYGEDAEEDDFPHGAA